MGRLLKRLVVGAGMVLVSPLILAARLALALGGEDLFSSCGCLLSLIPGRVGSYLRVAYYKGTLTSISADSYIGFGSYFSRPEATVGSNVSIGAYCVLGKVTLGDRVLIASRVSIPSGKRQHAHLYVPSDIARGVNVYDRIVVGGDSWIGEGAILLGSLGERCIVSAGAVVTRDIPANRLVGGNPARVLHEFPPPKAPETQE